MDCSLLIQAAGWALVPFTEINNIEGGLERGNHLPKSYSFIYASRFRRLGKGYTLCYVSIDLKMNETQHWP